MSNIKLKNMEDTIQQTSPIELEVKVKVYDRAKGELIDAIAAGAKLSKADAGKCIEKNNFRKAEVWLGIKIEPCANGDNSEFGYPKVTARSHAKLTKADAGRITKGDAQ